MEINKIRIGNFLEWEDESHDIIKVSGIFQDYDGQYWISYGNKTEGLALEFVGVKLNDEWFYSAGFFNMNYGYEKDIEPDVTIRFICSDGKYYPQIEQISESSYDPQMIVSLPYIEYVHELQNIWAVVSGGELVLVPPTH